MKKAVMYGAGNIGRGFIGKVFSESDYEVCFVDVVEEVVDELNDKNKYPVKIVANDGNKEVVVSNIRAVNGLNIDNVADEIANADIMATAVGVKALPKIIPPHMRRAKKTVREKFSTIEYNYM
jgi:mannitol-1-phosphate 5-dehydrogenase